MTQTLADTSQIDVAKKPVKAVSVVRLGFDREPEATASFPIRAPASDESATVEQPNPVNVISRWAVGRPKTPFRSACRRSFRSIDWGGEREEGGV
uniref:Uncharacterized protein n=1 Tax=Plectus sambesii TaxID=2011161 RepID=A0A914X2C6_9BILA